MVVTKLGDVCFCVYEIVVLWVTAEEEQGDGGGEVEAYVL